VIRAFAPTCPAMTATVLESVCPTYLKVFNFTSTFDFSGCQVVKKKQNGGDPAMCWLVTPHRSCLWHIRWSNATVGYVCLEWSTVRILNVGSSDTNCMA
jgi:hypothetical protein